MKREYRCFIKKLKAIEDYHDAVDFILDSPLIPAIVSLSWVLGLFWVLIFV